ncbi:hypothetical protein QE439_001480 [Pedobacter agri]|nr:hypothetical protein [Pedobacter agri]
MHSNKFLTCLFAITFAIISCNNPKDDAEKVCGCFQTAIQKLQSNPEDYSYSLQKCMALSGEFEIKYSKKPQKLIEYHIQLDSCNKNRKTNKVN